MPSTKFTPTSATANTVQPGTIITAALLNSLMEPRYVPSGQCGGCGSRARSEQDRCEYCGSSWKYEAA